MGETPAVHCRQDIMSDKCLRRSGRRPIPRWLELRNYRTDVQRHRVVQVLCTRSIENLSLMDCPGCIILHVSRFINVAIAYTYMASFSSVLTSTILSTSHTVNTIKRWP